MADPQRLLADPEGSPLGRALLASAEGDAMPPESRARVAGKLGIAATLALTTTTAGQGLAAAVWWKIGTVVIALAGVTALAISQTPGEPPPPTPTVVVAPSPPAQEPRADHVENPPAPPPTATIEVAPPAPAPEPARPVRTEEPRALPTPTPPAPRPPVPSPSPTKAPVVADAPVVTAPPPVEATPAPPPAPAPVKVDARRLAAEVALLDRARAAVRGRDTRAAAAALDEYARTFPDGALLAEAEVVGIEALVQRGDTAAAAARARAFLARFPHSPLARRVRSLALAQESP